MRAKLQEILTRHTDTIGRWVVEEHPATNDQASKVIIKTDGPVPQSMKYEIQMIISASWNIQYRPL